MTRTVKLYLLITSIAVLGIFALLNLGGELAPPPAPAGVATPTAPSMVAHPAASEGFLAGATSALFQNSASGLSRLFLQLFVIIVVSSIFGGLFTRIGHRRWSER